MIRGARFRRNALAAVPLLGLLLATPVAGQFGVLDQPFRNDPFVPLLDGGWSFTHHLSVGMDNNVLGVGDMVALTYVAEDFRPTDVFLVAGIVPEGEGIRLGTQDRTGVTVGFPMGNYVTMALVTGGRVLGTGRVPDDIAALARDGVTGDAITVDLTELGGEVFGYAEAGLSALAEVPVLRTPFGRLNLLAGAGARYVYGISHIRAGFSGDDGQAVSTFTLASTGISTSMLLTRPLEDELLAEDGQGYAFDAMVGGVVGDRAQLRVAVTDLGSAEMTVGRREVTTVSLTDVPFNEVSDSIDAAAVTDTVAATTRSVPLPTTLRVDASFRPIRMVGLGARLAVPLNDDAPALEPLVQAGLELRPVAVLPLRLGVTAGGDYGTGFFGGLGVDTGGFALHLELASSGGPVLADIRGVAFRTALSLNF